MAINNINWTALNTLNGVINNALDICNEQNATDDAVMHLTNGDESRDLSLPSSQNNRGCFETTEMLIFT